MSLSGNDRNSVSRVGTNEDPLPSLLPPFKRRAAPLKKIDDFHSQCGRDDANSNLSVPFAFCRENCLALRYDCRKMLEKAKETAEEDAAATETPEPCEDPDALLRDQDKTESSTLQKSEPSISETEAGVVNEEVENEEEIEDPEDSNTTNPLLAHTLYIPYDSVPRPRFFSDSDKVVDFKVPPLPRRARSPLRKLLPGEFELSNAESELKKCCEQMEAKRSLRESIYRFTEYLMRMCKDEVDTETLIKRFTIQLVLEQIILAPACATLNLNPKEFVDYAALLALGELHMVDSKFLEKRGISKITSLASGAFAPPSVEKPKMARLTSAIEYSHLWRGNIFHRWLPWSTTPGSCNQTFSSLGGYPYCKLSRLTVPNLNERLDSVCRM